MNLLIVALAAAIGAPARYVVDQAVQHRHDRTMPWGTFVINVTGSLVLGLVAGLVAHHGASAQVQLGVGTGFCGAFTTFSSFGYETLRLVEDGALGEAMLNVVGSVLLGALAAAAGWGLTILL